MEFPWEQVSVQFIHRSKLSGHFHLACAGSPACFQRPVGAVGSGPELIEEVRCVGRAECRLQGSFPWGHRLLNGDCWAGAGSASY